MGCKRQGREINNGGSCVSGVHGKGEEEKGKEKKKQRGKMVKIKKMKKKKNLTNGVRSYLTVGTILHNLCKVKD